MITLNLFNSSCTDRNGNPKQTYSSQWEAEEARDRGRYVRSVELRVYQCPQCRGYHLTSKLSSY